MTIAGDGPPVLSSPRVSAILQTMVAVLDEALSLFRERYGRNPETAVFAPGRIEVLGNHTDYNEGFVLSAAVNLGTYFLAAARTEHRPSGSDECRVFTGNLQEEVRFNLDDSSPADLPPWARYVFGCAATVKKQIGDFPAFDALIWGDVPIGAGLGSSASLEVSTVLGVSGLAGLSPTRLETARIGQHAEHVFAGVRTGLLDQITILAGKRDHLVFTDFRTLETDNYPLGENASFLVCRTDVKHDLVDSEYNERRRACERGAAFFAAKLNRSVKSLRDVTLEDWDRERTGLDDVTSRRVAHILEENARVQEGSRLLEEGNTAGFGDLLYRSHESSRNNYENSCTELDHLVEETEGLEEVYGARLSGGGFGGSVIALVVPGAVERVTGLLIRSYRERFDRSCDVLSVRLSDGAGPVLP